jgi:integrase/recombinase XerD
VYGFVNYLYELGDLKFSCIATLLFESGLRVSECLKLKWDNIVWKENKIKVPEDTKTGFRNVLFSDNTKNLLNEYQSSNHYNPDIVFYFEVRDDSKSKVTNNKSIRTRVFKKIREYGLKHFGFEVHPHTFRHSCGYYLRNVLKIPLDEVAIYLGHSKIDTTRIYAHTKEDVVLNKVKKSFENQ